MLNEVVLDPIGGKAKRAVIIIHGLGDSASGIIGLGEAMRPALPETIFLAPDAPEPCELSPFGYQWFSGRDWSPAAVLKGVQEAAPKLNAYIDHVMESRDLKAKDIALLGFSQGTMMSLYVAPRREENFAGILGYSGALIGGETLAKERKSNAPVMLIHGQQDDVVPFAALDHARFGLESVNINVQTVACPGLAHSVDDLGLTSGLKFLRQVFGV